MPPTIQPAGPLATAAYAALHRSFADYGHAPSTEQWTAMADLLNHLQCAADGKAGASLFVSAIPAGTGKSASLAAFASALCSDDTYTDTGMLILCNRIEECADMARALQHHGNRLCIIVSKDDITALGAHATADAAQILIATQASLRQTLRTVRDFSEAARFHYLGKRRPVVCWDEAISFSRPVVLADTELGALFGDILRQAPDASHRLLLWAAGVLKHPRGACEVPDFASLGLDFAALEAAVGDDDLKTAAARTLATMSGGTAWIERDNLPGSGAVVAAVPDIPNTILPAFVTDASAARGVNHRSYERMSRNRRMIRLTEAEKTYSNLTLRIVDTGASRSAFRDRTGKGAKLLDIAVHYIQSVIRRGKRTPFEGLSASQRPPL